MEKISDEKIFFIADTHFGSEKIFHYENRPFDSVEAMNDEIVKNRNSTVGESDIVRFLGDFGDDSFFLKLNGKKYLVKGNHEAKENEYYRELGFIEVYDMPVVFQNFWILSHEPLYVNANMPYANIFAHVHLDPKYKTVSEQSFCVSCDRICFKPVSFAEVKKKINECK